MLYGEFKRGQSLSLLLELPDSYPVGYFIGWTLTSQVRTRLQGALINTLTVSWADVVPDDTRILKVEHLDTVSWPIQDLDIDILFVSPTGTRLLTDTISLKVVKEITRV